jgi:single-stranded DNA-binding protein
MAKENYVLLVGELQGSPIIDREDDKAKYVLKTLRRNDKIDFPVINVFDSPLIDKVESFKEGDYVIVKGFISTQEVVKGVVCPNCQGIVRAEGTVTEIYALENTNIGKGYDLESIKELSNTVIVLGSLCRDVEFRLLPNTGIPSAQYQLAVNRKYNSKRQRDSYTDYPWVNSFGRQAEQDALRLETGSQVLIQGGVQTRNVQKAMVCENCQTGFKAEDFVAEIVPYSVEYLNNCKFE